MTRRFAAWGSEIFGLIIFLCRKQSIPLAWLISLAFLLAGGMGNLIDRIANKGLVTDFINIGIGPVRTGVFNVADMAITFGTVVLACQMFRHNAVEPEPRPDQGKEAH